MKLDIEREELPEKIGELSGQNVFSCFQCGICTGTCPFSDEMDLGPRKMLNWIMQGKTEVLDSNTPWICASCFQCVVQCPNEIDIASVSEAVRQITQRRGIDHIKMEMIPQSDRERIPQIAFVGIFRRMTQ